ncbi:aspartate/glutamate racemase family protein [Patescibacteria group bacterium]|nr:aspartate/glutamate racemase family protein [Patescibacteria group bacterium]
MIGIFDSGLGGLTILKEIKNRLPQYDYFYFGDTLHVPYGNRSDKAVYELTKKACDYLFARGCHLIILACNTASARALRKLQHEYLPAIRGQVVAGEVPAHKVVAGLDPPLLCPVPPLPEPHKNILTKNVNILGVIRPLIESIVNGVNEKVAVIGTRGTVNSKSYIEEIHKLNPKIKVEQAACPLLVPLIEENWLNRKETKSILRHYLRPLKLKQVETLILGCTHYPMLLKQIRSIMGKNCFVPNPGEIVAASLEDYLHRHSEMESRLTKNFERKYVVTDLNENFKQMAARFLDEKIEVEEITI